MKKYFNCKHKINIFQIISGSKMDSMLRYGTLVILVLQTTATVLLLRYSRTRPGQPYLASTAVMLNECCKFTVCVFSLYAQRGKKRPNFRQFSHQALTRQSSGRGSCQVSLIWLPQLLCSMNVANSPSVISACMLREVRIKFEFI